MSFQHFRLGEFAMNQPLPPHLIQHIPQQPQFQQAEPNADPQTVHSPNSAASASKQPYGSGDTDDGYTLVFPNLAAFHAWRTQEEETQMVEFVKGDTHGSKAVPPRFKDHTKLVCARHSRSGRKKYVKKHPERIRKVPSRKLEGQGCPASISYKTYYGTEEVRACYMSHHSHEIGPANLPFTRRGRKAAVQQEKDRSKRVFRLSEIPEGSSASTANANSTAGQSSQTFSSTLSMVAPLPGSLPQQSFPQSQPYPQQHPGPQVPTDQGRWDRMGVLFQSIRDHARGFDYPIPSVAALESVLIRLYLESPIPMGGQNVGQPHAQSTSQAPGGSTSTGDMNGDVS